MASLLKEHFLSLGCQPAPKQLSEVQAAIPGARAFSGMQSRKKVAPLISEFASVHSVILPLPLASKFLSPGYKLPAEWAVGPSVPCQPAIPSFPAGSRVLRAHVVQGEQEGKDLSLLLDLLPSANLRWSEDSQPTAKSFQVGSFVRETAKAMCAYVKQIFPAFTFGTVGAVQGRLCNSTPGFQQRGIH